MAFNSSIEWTNDTWNPWQGCQKVSPGCKFCYMYRDKKRYGQDPMAVVRSKPGTFNAPLTKLKGPLVFTCSWSDFFIEQADNWRDDAWDIIRKTPHLTYQILTKRPENIKHRLPDDWGDGWPNVWLGVSVENQEMADKRIPILLSTPASIRFLSVEPMLGPVGLSKWLKCPVCNDEGEVYEPMPPDFEEFDFVPCSVCDGDYEPSIHWVIVGGESGPGARPMKMEWAADIIEQCYPAGVSVFIKQMGDNPTYGCDKVTWLGPKGGDMSKWPKHLQVREFPTPQPRMEQLSF